MSDYQDRDDYTTRATQSGEHRAAHAAQRTTQAQSTGRTSSNAQTTSRARTTAGRSASTSSARRTQSARTNRSAYQAYNRSTRRSQDSYKRNNNLPIITLVVAILLIAALVAIYLTQCTGKDGQGSASASASSAAMTTGSSTASDASADASEDASESASAESAESAEAEPGSVKSPDGAELQVDYLIEVIGEEETEKLLAQAETNADAYWIASHVDQYEFEGETVMWKILKLAADEPLSLGYVRDFAEKYPQDEADMDPALAMDESYLAGTKFDTGVPHLYQWDRRWGQIIYCSTTFGLTGCGPACMAMVYQGLTGNDDLTPYDMAIRAQEGGYMAQFDGTSTGFFFAEAEADGLYCRQIDISADSIRESLYNGEIIIANLGQGYFTIFGHFFVLVGVDENGDIIINDPYSEVRSTQTWDADLIADESIALFAFGIA